MNLMEMLETCDTNRTDAEERLKALCEESKRLKYEDLIDKLLEITENKLGINSYKFTSFITWLVEDLEHCKQVNGDSWHMTFKEIEETFNDEYWKDQFNEVKKENWNTCETWKNFRDEYSWWSYEYCLESVLNSIKREYEIRKEKGMI